jgi:hypothetical protein
VPKKNGKLKICVNFIKLNVTTKKYPYQFSFNTNEVLNIVVGHDAYSFLDGYFGYHHISIVLENRYPTTFVIDWGTFTWVILPLE